jgi:UDP-N-acetylglucosamine diphosphorylase / glucose-1-phosphate thymidylyltransferase / UDP-N-acetylgalactosamine diphosphorylase / glucosamine-1-phosphate N-acetyltransferase / galactosamine-1-phosphate N-acetyltransferase
MRGGADLSLLGRTYLKEVVQRDTRVKYNDAKGAVLLVNARVNPVPDIAKWLDLAPGSAVIDRGGVAAASVRSRDLEKLIAADGTIPLARLASLVKGFERLDAPKPTMFTYPWDVLECNGAAINAAAGTSRKKLLVSAEAEVEEFVSFDLRDGPVIVADKARIEAFSRVSGPCYIGKETTVQSALIRGGTTIGEGCKVGGEVASSVIYPHTNKAHLGYLGHSIVGEWVNIGAGAITSDLKNTYGNVRVVRRGKKVDTGLVKLGALVGDMAKVSIGSMLYSGKTLGVAARCAGVVDRDVPDFTSYDGTDGSSLKLELEPVLLAQERMKGRRRQALSSIEKKLIGRLYSSASKVLREH